MMIRKPLRIAQVCPYDMSQPGGVQLHTRCLSAALREAGHEVTVIAPFSDSADCGEHEFNAGKPHRIAFNRTNIDISWVDGERRRQLRQLLQTGRFDVIHYHTPWTPFLTLQVLRHSTSANVATFHDTTPETVAGRITRRVFRLISRRFLRRFDSLVTVSHGPARNLAIPAGLPHHILPPCTDFRRFMDPAEPFADYRDDMVNVLFLGRLEPRKGIMDLMEAYRRLVAQGVPVRLLIVGSGELRDDVLGFATSNRLIEVKLLGRVSEEDKRRWYATADIFCAPTRYGESFGIVLAEAMASGKPVIAAANLGYETVLTGQGEAGLYAPGDITALTRRLKRFIDDRQLRTRLGEWGRREAERFDCANRLSDFLDIYNAAIDDRLTY